MNQPIFPRNSRCPATADSAFTLVEMLVVIAIIGVLAGLIVSGAGIASAKMRRARVEAERDALITAIESYHKTKGFYPPDNTNSPTQNQLYYELTGTALTNIGGSTVFLAVDHEQILPANMQNLFHVDGFLNSSTLAASADANPAVNFYKSLKVTQYAYSTVYTVTVLGIPVDGPLQLTTTNTTTINPWRYVVSNPTNNQGSYDLWMDVKWGGKTNRISNWSRDPQIVSY